MKILLVNSYYFPDSVGGAEKSSQLLAEEFHKKGHDVLVFTAKHAVETKVNGIDIVRADTGKFNINTRLEENGSFLDRLIDKIYEINNKYIYNQLTKTVEEFSPDVIFTNNLYALSSIVWQVAFDNGIPLFHTVRDYWIFDCHSKLINFIHKPFYRRRSQFVNTVVAPSKSTMNIVDENKTYFKKTKHVVIPNGIQFDIETVKLQIKRKINSLKMNDLDELNIIFVGRIDNNKGILNLIQSLDHVKLKYKLHICGTGPLVNEVNGICKTNPNIIYHGKLNKNDLEKVYSDCDVLVAPSVWLEPFGLVVVEAMIHGCCILGSNFGGISEIIEYTKSGQTFDPNNIQDIAEAVNSLTRDKIIGYLENIYGSIEFYNISNTADKYLKEFQEVLTND